MYTVSIAGWSIEKALQKALVDHQTQQHELFRLEVELACGGVVGPRTTIALIPLRTSNIAAQVQAEEKARGK